MNVYCNEANKSKEVCCRIVNKKVKICHVCLAGFFGSFKRVSLGFVRYLNMMRNFDKTNKSLNLLKEVRGFKAVDLEIMKNILINLSQMVEDNKEIKEVDINPIMVSDDGEIFAVDARIILN